ncbi:Polyketide synthase PksM [Streptomyces sp. ADI98-12]|uniref:L-histidine N(alpha)-methyltransferase n=1 Tax=Streptomyces sp. ADI98-12 TaxID=1522764 RepID=UPI000F5549BE|nr:SDR family NAD(P)-dependent oxidoreductase [Streptomyces sp. ADI98-12]RPK79151.1 Polyketide synthase PksM [Streptomyces sp. ADI98-12]
MGNSTEDRAARLVVLSAGGRDQLDRYRAELVTWLQAHPEAPLDRIESTLRTGREELAERLAVVVTSIAELTERLRDGTGVVTGTAGPATGNPVQASDLHEAARLWVAGTPVRWPEQPGRRPARLSLPQPPPATRRYWIKPPAALTAEPAERLLTGDEFFLRDHALGQVRILPAVAALEFAVDAAARAGHGRATGVENVLWARPVLFTGEPVRVQLRFAPVADGVAYELRRVDGTPDGELCSTGTLRFGATAPAPPLDLAAIRARLPRTTSADDCYAVFAALGGGYGPSLRGLRSMRSVQGEALAEVAVPDAADLPFDDFTLHPSLLDAMLQAALWTAADPSAPRPRELPFSIDRVEILGPLPEHGYAHAVATATGHDIALADAEGRIAVRLHGVVTRAVKDPADAVDTHLLAQRWQDAPARRGALAADRMVILGTGEDGPLPDSGPLVVVRLGDDDPLPGLVGLFRTWAAQPNRQPIRVLHVFRPSGAAADARLLAVDGMARSIANEHPDFRAAVITTDGADLRAVADAEAAADHEFRVRYTAAGRQVARWEPIVPAPVPAPLTPAGTVLVTGGAGALGRHLVSHLGPSARYVLTGRSADADLTALRAAGLDVHYLPCDLGAPGAAERLVERIHQKFGPLRGVLHLAGVTRDSFLLRKTDEDIAAVLGPKVDGTLALDRATAADPLDFFVCFSSMSGAGSPGQADYAYANRFLDAFAAWRRGSDRPGRSLSVLWSLWADGGIRMDADDTTQARIARRAGLRPLPTADALRAWDRALGHDGDHVLVAHGELDRIRGLLDAPSPVPVPAPTAATGPATAAAEDFLRGVLAEVLEYPPEDIEADTAFEQYGIDSLLIMELTRRLEDHFGSLPKTLFFEYQELRGLAGWFAEHHGGRLAELTPAPAPAPALAPVVAAAPDAAPSGDRPTPPSADAPEPIAIIGVAARFAESDTLDEFWANLRAGRDLITEIPADRWDWRDYDEATPADRAAAYSRWGSFLRGIDRFDPLFFGISPREAEIIDPQERLFLQTAWHAMEDAGLTRGDLRARRVGVYAGAMYGLYQLHEAADGRIGASSHASIANRVSYTLGVTGPSLGVDTMCSSSLTAIHLAVRDLRCGEAEMALAGGVNLHVHPYKYRFLGQGSFTSSDGRCRSFGADGDGYVPGEGVGAVLLKPLSAAVRDGDHIHGVILGSSVNHGGRTNGFTVPNPVAQSDLVERALAEAGSAATLGYLEAHGTGTALGDPVEIRALARALGASGLPRGSLPIGSVKSNIGHLESASGMAGLCKVLLQMRHGELVPSLHADPVNPNIDFDSTPLRVQTEVAPWPRRDGLPRRAGISSFGAGGANAHLVVEEYVPGPAPAAAPGPWLFPLSARTPESLRALAERLADAVENGLADRLADVAYTLQHGREAWADRMVVLAATADQLADRLRAGTGTGVWTGSVRGRGASRAAAPATTDPAGLAAAWTAGATVAWPGTGRRLPLPGYPFEELRCWLTEQIWAPPPAAGPATHPLLDEIEPSGSVDGLTYRTAFSPAHPLIDGHRVGDLRLLPAAAVLEMARAAAAHAGYPAPVRLRDVRWLRPLVVTEAAASARTRLRRDGAGLAFTLLGDTGDTGDTGDRLAEGVVEALADDVPEPVPVELLRATLPHRHDGADVYADLAGAGLVYGPALRAVEWIAAGDGEALASLRVPAEAARFAGCALPPALIDGALHTFAVLRDRAGGPAMVPFALAAAEVFGPLPEQAYAHVRAVGPDRYDLTLTDPAGTVRVRLRDLSLRPAPAPRTSGAGPSVTTGPAVTTGPVVTAGPAVTERPVDDLMYLPRWSPAPAEPLTAPGSDTWLIRPSSAAPLAAALAARLGGSVTEIEPEHFTAPAGRPGHVIVLSGPAQGRTDDPAALDLAQERGVLALFRVAKALQRSGAPVRLTVVTEAALSTGTEPVRNPYAAALHGLALSLAQEHPRWRVAVVDRSSADPVSADVLDVPAGGPYALRAGVLYRRSLVPAAATATREAIRHGGVYLILGGAGGLGLELTEWLVRGYRAKVVLVGRSELDADRRDRLRRLDPAGELVSYRRADATDPAALGEVVTGVRAEHGALHGVVHATIVLRDQTVATMTEDTFRAVLDAKTRTSVALHRALGAADGLDFVLFFSSAVALSGSAGQANYAAGSTFEDAFAHHLDDVLAARSAVINWGYWGTVGIVADDRHRERLARTGIHSITPAEGMAAVHDVLGRTDRQVVVIKATAEVLAAAGVERPAAEQSDDELAPSAAALPPVARLLTETDQARLDEVVLGWLWELFRGEGVFRTVGERWSADELRRRLRIADGQSRLFAELLRVLTVAGFLYDDGSALTATDRPALTDPENELVALCEGQPALNRIDRLLRPCMHHLFGVLRGTVRATEVMFPGGSTELVEGAYRGSPVVDRANELVVAALLDRVGRLGGPVTVVEVGAGTGGTTASLLPALAATGAELTYVYTDISPAFLQHGRQRFAERYPMVRFQQLDISGDPLTQGFPPGGADIVVAANVLHATPDLPHTLRAVAMLIKPGGHLVLNEATSNVVTATLTFGLLDGWWLHRDTGLRLPGSPLLSGPGWRTALDLAGFARSRAFPADEGLTQHVVVAETGPAGPASVAAPTAEPAPAPAAEPAPAPHAGGEGRLVEAAREYVKDAFVQVLQVPRDRLWLDETYENFGVDSLTVPRIADLLAERMGDLPATLLFERPTIREVADYLVERYPDSVRALVPDEPRPAPAQVTERAGRPAETAPAADTRIAVIGVAGRYPLADDVDAFWTNLRTGRDCIREVPAGRWDPRTAPEVNGTPVSRWGGFLDRIDEFDPRFFQMSMHEAELTDPQERLFLQTAWHTLEDAGYPRIRLRGSRVGVYVGVMYGHYQLFEDERGLAGGMGYASIANRVSYALDLHGPSLAVDTMCSSSLTAIHLACEALAAGSADYALAGGVNLTPHPRIAGRPAGWTGVVTTEPGAPVAPSADPHDTARRWVHGEVIDWAGTPGSAPEPLSLPGYPFEPVRCWIRAAAPPAATPPPTRPAGSSGPALTTVLRLVSGVSGYPVADLDPAASFHDHGLDSLALLRLAGDVSAAFEVPVGPDQLLATPTAASLADWLAREHPRDVPARPATPEPDDPVVIVGMAGTLPGSTDLDEFWAALERGGDLFTEVPADRWDAREHHGDPAAHPERTRVTRAGFIGGIDRFDPLFFGISPREARWMDPRQRLLMRTVWAALEDAGMDPGDLAGSDTGLFVGVGSSEYAELIQRSGAATDAYSSTGLAPSMLANRISYQLDLHGPSEPVDTACSSSLVALHRAAEALRLGRCGTVIVGGVSLMLSPVTFASLERAGMLSPDGVGRAFDADAAGYVRGEGVGAVVLKRLSRARADGNPILAVLRGTAVNHGGRANSLTAPNPRAQADVIRQAHREAAVDPATIGYLETHGTGTVIGDPAETNGLREAFADLYQDWGHDAPARPHCALGALKNTIGHLEPAAGIAAVLRVLLSMRHGRISGDPHGPRPNLHLGLEGTPFELATGPREWAPPAPGVPRRAGVSAFGYGGANAHVVLEEYPAEEPVPAPGPVVFVLSARDPERLRAYARSFADRPDRWAHDLAGTAYTLQVGRGAYPERLAFVTDSAEHAVATLRRFLAGDTAGMHTGRVERDADRTPYDGHGDDETAAAWVRGAQVDWHRRWAAPPRRRSLPTYPFAQERHWFTDGTPARPVSCFTATWQDEPVPAAGEHPGRVLVLGDLPVPGAVHVRAGTEYRDEGSVITIRSGEQDDYARLLAETPARIVHQWPLLAPGRDDLGIEAMFRIAKELTAGGARTPIRIQALVPEDALAEAWGGFDASLRAALPGTTFSVVRVDGAGDTSELLAEIAAHRLSGPAVRLSPSGRTVRVLSEIPARPVLPSPLRDGGVYLITGGLGGLGVLLARMLLSRGARVALTGRSPAAERAEQLAELRAHGTLEYYQAAVEDRDAMTRVVAEVIADLGGLDGVFHLAGTASRNPLPGKDVDELRAHLRARITGTRVLDEVTRDLPLDLFVLYSSLAGQLGDYGLVDYAVGARYLDGFADFRERDRLAGRRHGRTVSVDWPMWRAGGMHVDTDDERRYLAGTGFRYLETAEGEQVLDLALRLDRPQVAVLPGDPARMRDLVAGMRLRDDGVPVLPAPPPTPAPTIAVSPELATQLRELIGEILGITPSALDLDAGFGEYGPDSFGLQNLAAALATRYDVTVPTTTLFGANTITKLAAHLADELPPAAPVAPQAEPAPAWSESAPAPAPAPAEPTPAPVSVPHGVSVPDGVSLPASGSRAADQVGHEPIAIIGLAGRLPGADDLESFWRHLADGQDLITETPADRWDWREVARRFGGTARWGGFLTGVDHFDPLFFRISPAEAQAMDPQHRLFLEHTWAALEDAGCRPDRLAGGRVCVFAGVQFTDYESMVLRGEHVNAHAGTGLARTMLANRISYLLDLRGPSESVDTACSSSLVALHRAVRSLRAGESELAIAGGVSLVLSPQTVVAGNQLGVLAPDGRCKALDERADGYVKGEGVGVVVLKTLSRALADGDRVHAVIRGSAVNHGGRASSLTSPNPLAQADLLVEAYRDADVPIETVSYVELHGTGTALGDPVEIDGLIRAQRTLAAGPAVTCGIGTVKSNIGHLEPAAGIAGVIKVVLAMRHRQLPPTLHLSRLNPLIELDGTPFEPVRETRPWAPNDADGTPVPLRAGVSSFGFGGVNAHVVLEEPPATSAPVESAEPEIFLLSARDEAALHRYARAHWTFLGDQQPALSSLAHTSQVGRVPMPVRLALVVTSVAELRDQLAAFLAGDIEATTVTGAHDWLTEPEGVSYLRRLAWEGRLDRIARLWQDGAAVDWAALRTDRPALASMPTYPFARERHWLTSPSAPPPQDDARRLLAKAWEPAPASSGPAPHAPVVLVRAETEALATAAFGDAARVVRLDDTDEETGLRAAASIGRAPVVIDLVDLSAVPVSDVRVDWARIVLARELIAANRTAGFAYLHMTRGLVSFRAHSPTLRGAAFAGLVRMLSAEYRGVFARTVDVDVMDPDALRDVAAAELAATDPVTEVCVRDGARYTPALRPTGNAPAPARWSDDLAGQPVVITGGTGALGRLLAAELVERGADRLVLLGQSPLPAREDWAELLTAPDTDPALAARLRDLTALERPGVRLLIESVPLERAREALDRIRQEWGPIAGIVHCAGLGVMTDPAFVGKRTADMRRVLEPKTTGLQALLDACADDPLRFVVLYSSVAGQVPALAAGMSDYALANSVLDRVAEYRSATSTGTTVFRSVQWPSWQAAGMPEVDTPAYRELGLRTLSPRDGVALLDAALAGPDPVVLPCLVDTTRFDADALLTVATPEPPAPVAAPEAPAPVAAADAPMAHGTRTGNGVRRLTEVFAATLRLDATQIRPDADFADLGVDSIMIAQLLAALERDLGVVAEPSALLENPTIAQLSAALDDQMPDQPVPEEPEPVRTPDPVRTPEPHLPRVEQPERGIAVVGIAAHFPGAPDHATFWRNLVGGVDSVTEVPPSRWDADRFWHPAPQPGRTVSKWGGFLDGIEDFDPDFFRLDPAGAAHVDPLVRQFLEAGAECLADAGLTPAEVAGRRVGVFAGARAANFGAHHAAATTHSISGMAQNFIAAHLSHYLDVRGPAVVVDSACSSALVAVHLAAQSLRTGESDLVIVGGVEILLDEVPFVGMSGAGALSPSGRCHTFDERADGIVLGEGVGALLLKRAEDAIRDGDRVYAVIEGSAVNNDGRTMGITTPNPRAQREVIESALAAAEVSPAQLGYVEAHGTGTMIGDPMELKALTEVLRQATDEVGFCGVGSVKTNIGHTLSAAGIAGLIKVVLSVHHGQLPPTLHCATLNRRFAFDRSPLFPVRELRDWTGRDGVRRAGVSSFGFGGTNAHMVVRQAPDGHVPRREPLDPPRYRRRRFWFDVPVPASANGNGRHDGPTPPAPFFQIQF